MEIFTFQIGLKKLEVKATSLEAAYNYAQSFASYHGWKGKIVLIN